MINYVTPGHPDAAGAGYDCNCGACLSVRVVLCAGCGRKYGRQRTQPALQQRDAGLAAVLTGWQQGPDGQWWCGILDCRPASAA